MNGCTFDADIDAVFDARDPAELARFGMRSEALAEPGWRDQMKGGAKARTQVFAETLRAQRYNGLLVRSFARGATGQDINLVL